MTYDKIEQDDAQANVLTPAADFRIKTLGPTIADRLQIPADKIWWQLLIDAQPDLTLNDIVKKAGRLVDGDPRNFIAIPPEYSEKTRAGEITDQPLTVYARDVYIDAANRNPERAGLRWFEVGPALRPDELEIPEEPFQLLEKSIVNVPEGTCVVAVIDNGMAVGHGLFRHDGDAAGPTSRVAFYWNMEGAGITDATLPGGATEPASLGNIWTGMGLTHVLRRNMHNGLLDDAAFYRDIGAIDWSARTNTPVAKRLSHGTHVMGLCAGYKTAIPGALDEALRRPIIAVNLRTSDIDDPSGPQFHVLLEQALFFIKQRHKRFRIENTNKKPPLVINFSFGNYAGPHDGTSLIERVIFDKLFKKGNKKGKTQFLLPAGNNNVLQCHARLCLTPAQPSQTLDWRLQPEDRSVSAVQLWLDKKGKVPEDFVRLTVTGPGKIAPVDLASEPSGIARNLRDQNGTIVGSVSFVPANTGNFKRGHFVVLLDATSHPHTDTPETPSGVWQLTLTAPGKPGKKKKPVGLKAWVLRDETLPGFPGFGRQSYFDDPDYARLYEPGVDADPRDRQLIGAPLGYDPTMTDALVRREGTLNGFASLPETIVVGGFRGAVPKEAAAMALYSSSGPTNTQKRTGPDASAQSDASPVLVGVLSAGSASGSMISMPGTSVSTPQVARLVAGLVAAQPANTMFPGPGEVRAIASTMDPNAQNNPGKPPDIRSGAGRLLELTPPFQGKRWPGQSY